MVHQDKKKKKQGKKKPKKEETLRSLMDELVRISSGKKSVDIEFPKIELPGLGPQSVRVKLQGQDKKVEAQKAATKKVDTGPSLTYQDVLKETKKRAKENTTITPTKVPSPLKRPEEDPRFQRAMLDLARIMSGNKSIDLELPSGTLGPSAQELNLTSKKGEGVSARGASGAGARPSSSPRKDKPLTYGDAQRLIAQEISKTGLGKARTPPSVPVPGELIGPRPFAIEGKRTKAPPDDFVGPLTQEQILAKAQELAVKDAETKAKIAQSQAKIIEAENKAAASQLPQDARTTGASLPLPSLQDNLPALPPGQAVPPDFIGPLPPQLAGPPAPPSTPSATPGLPAGAPFAPQDASLVSAITATQNPALALISQTQAEQGLFGGLGSKAQELQIAQELLNKSAQVLLDEMSKRNESVLSGTPPIRQLLGGIGNLIGLPFGEKFGSQLFGRRRGLSKDFFGAVQAAQVASGVLGTQSSLLKEAARLKANYRDAIASRIGSTIRNLASSPEEEEDLKGFVEAAATTVWDVAYDKARAEGDEEVIAAFGPVVTADQEILPGGFFRMALNEFLEKSGEKGKEQELKRNVDVILDSWLSHRGLDNEKRALETLNHVLGFMDRVNTNTLLPVEVTDEGEKPSFGKTIPQAKIFTLRRKAHQINKQILEAFGDFAKERVLELFTAKKRREEELRKAEEEKRKRRPVIFVGPSGHHIIRR